MAVVTSSTWYIQVHVCGLWENWVGKHLCPVENVCVRGSGSAGGGGSAGVTQLSWSLK